MIGLGYTVQQASLNVSYPYIFCCATSQPPAENSNVPHFKERSFRALQRINFSSRHNNTMSTTPTLGKPLRSPAPTSALFCGAAATVVVCGSIRNKLQTDFQRHLRWVHIWSRTRWKDSIVPDFASCLLSDWQFDNSLTVMAVHTSNKCLFFASPFLSKSADYVAALKTIITSTSAEDINFVSEFLYPNVLNGTYGNTSQTSRFAVALGDIEKSCNAQHPIPRSRARSENLFIHLLYPSWDSWRGVAVHVLG